MIDMTNVKAVSISGQDVKKIEKNGVTLWEKGGSSGGNIVWANAYRYPDTDYAVAVEFNNLKWPLHGEPDYPSVFKGKNNTGIDIGLTINASFNDDYCGGFVPSLSFSFGEFTLNTSGYGAGSSVGYINKIILVFRRPLTITGASIVDDKVVITTNLGTIELYDTCSIEEP